MATPITVSSGFQVGRADRPDLNAQQSSISFNADFRTDADITVDFSSARANQSFTIPRVMFIDNGSNPSAVEISVTQTDQFFTVPPYAQGTFKIDAQTQSYVRLVTVGGSTDLVTVTFYNYDVPLNVWYSFGAFNTNSPFKMEGTMNEGDTIAAQQANNPVFIGGKNYTDGKFYAIGVNALGQVDFSSTINVGNVKIQSAASVDWYYSLTTSDSAQTQPTANTPFTQNILRLFDGNTTLARARQAIAAQNSTGVGIQAVAISAQLDDTTPQTITENNFGNLRISADRSLIVTGRSTSGANASVPGTVTASTTIIAANNNRKGATVFNDSSALMYFSYGATCTTTSFTGQIQPNGMLVLDFDYVGIITGVWASATGNARITELV